MTKLKFKRRLVKQNIFNLNRGRPLRFVSSGHTSPAFGSFLNIPRVRSVSLFSPSMKRPALSFYGDSDKDGVMNGFDCAPFNKKKQGPEHKRIHKGPGNVHMNKWRHMSEEDKRNYRIGEIKERREVKAKILSDENIKIDEQNKKIYGYNLSANMIKDIKRLEEDIPKPTKDELKYGINNLSAKDEYKYRQGALVMKPSKEADVFEKTILNEKKEKERKQDIDNKARAKRNDKEKIFSESHPAVKAHREEEKRIQKEDYERSYEDEHELTSIPNPEGYDYDDNSDED